MTQTFMDSLVGHWSFEGRSVQDSGMVRTGLETVTKRGVWLVMESDDGVRFQLSFNPDTGRFSGDFVSWEYPELWVYEGALEAGRLVLNSRGPRMDGAEGETDYQDIWEITSPDERTLTGRLRDDNGEWRIFTTTSYRRRP